MCLAYIIRAGGGGDGKPSFIQLDLIKKTEEMIHFGRNCEFFCYISILFSHDFPGFLELLKGLV